MTEMITEWPSSILTGDPPLALLDASDAPSGRSGNKSDANITMNSFLIVFFNHLIRLNPIKPRATDNFQTLARHTSCIPSVIRHSV